MKILKLKFKNINSLAGENEIDFTEPKFTDNGIFAIIGKTGAGKSSILDAISLALYGKTPRFPDERNNPIEQVMTRGTKDCFAEVKFEVNSKIYVSHWELGKNKNDNFNPIKRYIADSENKIIAEKIRDCDDNIENILGLTFKQFTKVIMLAQGSFTAFLEANNEEKGGLLEQITGTEIYAEISKKVFERNKAEKEKLEKILDEIGAIKILSEEEIQALNTEIAEFEQQKQQLDIELQTIETAKKWLNDLSDLQKQISEIKTKLPNLEQQAEKAKITFEQAEIRLKMAKTEQEHASPILVKVRELDTKIAEKEKGINSVSSAINDLEKIQKTLSQNLENQQKDLEKSLIIRKEKQDWATLHSKYESLVEKYAVIENQHFQVVALYKDFELKNNDFEAVKKELQIKNANFQTLQIQFAEKESALKKKTQEFEIKKTELSAILSGKELADYQAEKENILHFGTQIRNLIDVEKRIFQNVAEIENHTKSLIFAEKTEQELAEKIRKNKIDAENLVKQIELLDENVKLAKTIQSLDEHRKLLEDGKVCPLCGALEHPFARGNEPKNGEKEAELANLKKQLQEITNAIQQDEKTRAKLISDKDNSLKNKQKEEANRLENQENQKHILLEIKTLNPNFCISDNENKITFLEEIRVQKQNDYKQIDSIISKATEVEKWIKRLQNEEIPLLQQTKQTAEKLKTDAETMQKLAEQQVENQQNTLKDAAEKHKEKNDILLTIFAEYGVDKIETLKQCLSDWNTNKKTIETLKEKIVELEKEFAVTNSEKTHNQSQIDAKIIEKENIETEKKKLLAERQNLFGDKQVENEEKRLKNLIEQSENAKIESEKLRTEADTELVKNQAITTEKENELTEKQTQKITEKTIEKLQIEFEEKKRQADEISQKIGANRQHFITNEENVKNSGKKLKDKELQLQICTKWASLNELIGSQDGKKYRNFAQALTFEHLIRLTNIQLQKILNRYVLKRVGDASNPFELSVIDKFQNCEERTAQNLSGGEKFIVSLSLALGLANMASKNMKIDTMFIDEGFGTLDSDYLDVALSALSNLQNEGKLIGVISHLAELKERIATHIEVLPSGNGYSKIG